MALFFPEESYKITGAIYEVHKELGPGLLEKVYQEAQVINYLAITGYQLGLLVNFNAKKVTPERIVRY